MAANEDRLRVSGCDFLIRKATKKGWHLYVRKALDGERTLLSSHATKRGAESAALTWAHVEAHRTKKGLPSQLVRKARPRVQIEEE